MDRADALRGARRLRERASTLAALPETTPGITRDAGAIAVIEHDGTNYDEREPDGTPNYAARARVAQRFYQSHGDNYDFLVVFTNFEFDTGDATAFHNLVRNDVSGIGKPLVDNGALFGAPGRLKGYVDMAALARYTRRPLSLQPGDPGFLATQNILAHELGHQWLAEVRYRDASGQNSSALLGREGAHWSYLLDSDASVLYGSDWVTQGGGNYVALRVQNTYSKLDLYLMGLLDPPKVGPLTLLRNPAIDPTRLPREGDRITATPETVGVGQIVAAEGERQPDHIASQKEFRLGFIFLTSPGLDPTPEDLAAVDRVRDAFAGHFFALTRGVAIADTTLAETPSAPPAPAPDLDKALAWLLAHQSLDGHWEDGNGTALRDTAAVLEALREAGQAGRVPFERGRLWTQATSPGNVDYVARRARALAPSLAGASWPALAQALLGQQNGDGGFGAALGYESDALDTALALQALKALQHPLDANVRRALLSLVTLRHASGGWPVVPGGDVSTVVTAHVLLALLDWKDAPETQSLVGPGLSALLARRNGDGGFGESPSTPYGTALALQVLTRTVPGSPAFAGAVAYLQGTQLPDGSWQGSPYQTALVLSALKGGVAPNLTVPQDGLVLDPPSAEEGVTVRVTARIRNSGRAAAGATRARLYDGSPATGTFVAEVPIGRLEPGAETTVSFDFPTTDRAGTHTLFVVADPTGEIAEAREDDNAASRTLQVTGPLPDLVVRTGDIVVTPYPPEEGETVQVAVTVRNAGERAARPSLLRLVRGNTFIGQASVPGIEPGQSVTLALAWATAGLRGDHVLSAIADANFALAESDETNNQASVPVTVTGPLPPGPDLEVASVMADPPSLQTIPQQIEVRALVRNLGRDPAVSTVALYDTDPPGPTPLAETPVSLGPRSGTTVTFPVTIGSSGNRTFVVVADPAGTLAETNENNNRASRPFTDPRNTLDLEIRPVDVTPSASDLVIGEVLTVTALVRNRGTAPVTAVPVLLAHAPASGLAELTRTTVTLAPGATTTVSLLWTTSFTGDPIPLAVVADPFDLLQELSETNNRVDLNVKVRPSALTNLAVSGADIAFTPDPPLEGESAVVSAIVRNPSPVAAGPFVVRFFRGDPDQGGTLIGEAPVSGAAAAGSTTAQVNWSPVNVRGAQGVFVIADAAGAVEEYDETDNRAFRPFQVLGLPDLVLATADVALDPAFPRAGEAVTVSATVRNLGNQPAPGATLRAFEGEAESGTIIAEVPIPEVAPGQAASLTFNWTPASPPGERTLMLLADADDVVSEQDEGNNRARRSVVVQNADLYLTAPYFSPDGDGVQDETTLAYRSTGSVTIVVSDDRGRKVRTLATGAPAQGSVVWDGRDDRGRLLWDGSYTLTLEGEAGVVLGRITAVLDTNRSSIHDAAGTGMTAVRNLTCTLPGWGLEGPVFLPSEDEALLIKSYIGVGESFPYGLLRVAMDGTYSYVAQDPWYEGNTKFASAHAVSPDGREVLIIKTLVDYTGQLYAVSLLTGQRRPLATASYLSHAAWSPDGRFIVAGDKVLRRDGTVVTTLPWSGWAWSPDGEFLARPVQRGENEFAVLTILRRDGTGQRQIPLPGDVSFDSFDGVSVDWLVDGRIYMRVFPGGPQYGAERLPDTAQRPAPASHGGGHTALLVDPDSGTTTTLDWLAQRTAGSAFWSPDGAKVLYRNWRLLPGQPIVVANEDGTGELQLVPLPQYGWGDSGASPRGTVAFYWNGQPAPPGPCAGSTPDLYVVTSLQNLTADLQASRLPGNNGVLVRGTVSDANLDHYQLEYATSNEPETWRPIGAASEIPVIDDVIGVWVPPTPGTYLLRLRVHDRAGNMKAKTRVVTWDRLTALANITQTEFLISPNDDGTKDTVRFNYLVQDPTRLEVRIVGPETAGPGGSTPPTVRRFRFDYPEIGPASFEWNGRDEAGQVVPDGRYTVYLNDLPFRVEVDTTPPDIGFHFENLRAGTTHKHECDSEDPVEVGAVVADRLWHAVDAHLKRWTYNRLWYGTAPVYEPVRDANGEIVYENGVPKIRKVNGQAVDRTDAVEFFRNLTAFEAEDHAGNRSALSISPVPERFFALEARPSQCELKNGRLLPPADPEQIYILRPKPEFILGTTFESDPPQPGEIRFQYQPRESEGGPWTEIVLGAFPETTGSWERYHWTPDLGAKGVPVGPLLRGRFVLRGIISEPFLFRLCDDPMLLRIDAKRLPGTELAEYKLTLETWVREPLVSATVRVKGQGKLKGYVVTLPMEKDGAVFRKTFVGPVQSCGCPESALLAIGYDARGASGQNYAGPDGVCTHYWPVGGRLDEGYPAQCPFSLEGEQEHRSCDVSSPDRVFLNVEGWNLVPGARIRIERGPEDAPIVLDEFDANTPWFREQSTVDVTGLPEGNAGLRGRLFDPDDPEIKCVAPIPAQIDRTPPGAAILQPGEGGRLCVSPDPNTGKEIATIVVRVDDAIPSAEIVERAFRFDNGPWQTLTRICPAGDDACRTDPAHVPTNVAVSFGWDVTGLPEGDYTVRFTFCDRSGNRTTIERAVYLSRQPPTLSLVGVNRPVFSPNGDGRSDTTTVTVRTAEALRLTAEVRQGSAEGAVVRTLASNATFPAGDHPFTWDGRDGSGQTASDGAYVLVVSGGDTCGGTDRITAALAVDTTPPLSLIAVPTSGQVLSTSVDVQGTAADTHFFSYTLTYGVGGSPSEWLPIADGTTPVGATPNVAGLLGRWNPPRAEGPYTLRLVAADKAENTAEAQVTVNVGPRAYLDHLTATPSVFSPNGDGRRETATIEYELLVPGSVTLQVRDAQGAVLRRLEDGVTHEAGTYAFAWNGATDAGSAAPEGDHVVAIRVEDPQGQAAPQEASVTLSLDRSPPTVTLEAPTAGSFQTRAASVRGTIRDTRLSEYVITATPSAGSGVELARGNQNREGVDLASLALLADGSHTLRVFAQDAAENRTSLDVPFTIDSISPISRIVSPASGAVLRKTQTQVAITGTATDTNLQDWILAFGPGTNPAYFNEIARGTTGGNNIGLASWSVASLPDGAYTVRLVVTDRAGQAAETKTTVTLDGTPPVATIATPAEGAYVKAEGPISGTASDANLDSWKLESAPGPAATAFQWTPLAEGNSNVEAASLATWAPLPPDGVHTLRLTVADRAGQSAQALRTVTVDTMPPASPTGLAAQVVRNGGSTADVRLTWNANAEPDLAGYRVSRDDVVVTPTLVASPSHTDPGRTDGRYRYAVVAVDRAGNVSAPATITARVDLTPPLVDILQPQAEASLSGSVDVRGTALSADDFKEYRLLVGAGANPTTWTLLRRSTLPVAAGVLGTWTAVGNGPFVIALEAEDTSGNQARVTVPVTVDNLPPSAPVLTSVTNVPEPTSLTVTWQPSPESDVAGYLIYRNGRIANAPGIVLGDLRGYLVPPPTYVDASLPDGRHCYTVVAMDQAGNLSPPSNEICQSLDNRPPQAVIVQPASGTRFEFPIRVVAFTPDTDIASIQFQFKPASESAWQALGSPDTAEPYETTLDPAGLSFGSYDLRAFATDQGGRTDPAPVAITVVYGDTTPPAPPRNLAAMVDGRQVSLTWTAGTEADLVGYHVYRGDQRVTTTPVATPAFTDVDVATGIHEYVVTAIDQSGNEGGSGPADAVVYAVALEAPYPVTTASSAFLNGTGARADTSVQVLRDATVVAQAPAPSAGVFTVPDVPLVTGPNLLKARGVDAQGNRSIPSDEVVLISNAPPAAVTGLAAAVSERNVTLTWDPLADAELFGYVVRRGDTLLTGRAPQTEASSVTASSTVPGYDPAFAFDGNPETGWMPDAGPASWTVVFPGSALVDRIELRFGAFAGPVSYRLEALWEDRWLALARVRNNADFLVSHPLPAPFATSALRVVIESVPRVIVTEVSVSKLAVVPAGTQTFTEANVPDGRHTYRLTAIDRYGAQGAPGTTEAPVGDVVPPSQPTGLVATVQASDVLLTWNANPEPDVTGYVVTRDGTRIATTTAPSYSDAGRSNGSYTYTVIAVDAVGNESPESDPATAAVNVQPPVAPVLAAQAPPSGVVALDWTHPGAAAFTVHRATTSGGPYTLLTQTGDVRSYTDTTAARGVTHYYVVRAIDAAGNASPFSNEASATPIRTEPPAAPVILFPTDAANPISLEATQTPVRGRAELASVVSVMVDGVLAGTPTAEPAFTEQGSRTLPPEVNTVAVSPDGRTLAYTPADAWKVRWIDLVTGRVSELAHPGNPDAVVRAFSADGRRLAYRTSPGDLHFVDIQTGAITPIETTQEAGGDVAFSPDGNRVAFTTAVWSGSGYTSTLWIRDLASGEVNAVDTSGWYGAPRWSPDGSRLALMAYPAGEAQLRIITVADGTSVTVPDVPETSYGLSWSPDSRYVAYTSASVDPTRIRAYDRETGTIADVTDGSAYAWDPRYEPAGQWISYGKSVPNAQGGYDNKIVARNLAAGTERDVAVLPDAWVLINDWTRHSYLALAVGNRVAFFPGFDGAFELQSVRLLPGENDLRARATDPASGLTGPDSEPVTITVPQALFPDLAVTAGDVASYPSVPLVGQQTRVSARVRNQGATAAQNVPLTLTVIGTEGTLLEQSLEVSQIAPGGSAVVSADWTPAAAGTYLVRAEADPEDVIVESAETNNEASRGVYVVATAGLVIEAMSDRTGYPARTPALLDVRVTNGGATFEGTLRTTVETAGGSEVALIDTRPLSLGYGQSTAFTVLWNTGVTYAGSYRFRARAAATTGDGAAEATRGFAILPDVSVSARLVPDQATLPAGSPLTFATRVENRGANTPLEGLVAQLRITAAAGGPPVFETQASLPRLLPGAIWESAMLWPAASPASDYIAELRVLGSGGTPLATATAVFTVTPATGSVVGRLRLEPKDILHGAAITARATVTNTGQTALPGHAFAVEVTSGQDPTVLLRGTFTLDLAPGETREATVTLDSASLTPGLYPVFLRRVSPAASLDRATLHVHGPITAPSIDSPGIGSVVATLHPTLRVNNATSPEGAALTYEFRLYADAALTQPLPGAAGVPETPVRTSWTVQSALTEDSTVYWRVRATDGFSSSPWTEVGSFRVDAVNLPPASPVPDTPLPGARVASREPLLTVRNAQDPDGDVLTYAFRVAADAEMTTIIASAEGVAEGPGLTSWRVPVSLQENATYYWSARASDPTHVSAWSVPISFMVDTVNESPSAPTPLTPVGGTEVPTLRPPLIVANASDPEGDTLTYVFQVDRVPSFDSPALQTSPAVPQGNGQTTWTPTADLADNTVHYWRAAASDGTTVGPWGTASFFVNLANDPPGVPVPLDPPDNGVVTTPTPTLRVRNTTDPDRDVLTYEFVVTNESGTGVASATGVPEDGQETTWTVTVPLTENARFYWSVRAFDGEAHGGWSAPISFRVNAVPDPPTAPSLVAPTEGSTMEIPRPALVISNATSPEGLPLTYTFELYAVGSGGELTLVEEAVGVAEGAGTTSWTPTQDLGDGAYAWRARAVDANQTGPWMSTAHFTVAVDRAPAPPTGLRAVPGDARVVLTWNASPEPDVVGYRVYRSLQSGGPYELVAPTTAPSYTDTGLTNGVTVYYVVTAVDARNESAPSAEVAATPFAGDLPTEVRLAPRTIAGECLLTCPLPPPPVEPPGELNARASAKNGFEVRDTGHVYGRAGQADPECPRWLFANLELLPGFDPASIELATVRLGGSVSPDPSHAVIQDADQDGIPELQLRFEFVRVRPLLSLGTNTLSVTGRVAGVDFRGTDTIEVLPLSVALRITPLTLNRRSQGEDVQARLSFCGCARRTDVDIESLRLNDIVPVKRVVSKPGSALMVKFDRAAVIAILPLGNNVEVRVTGMVAGLSFGAVDHIRVIE